MSKESKSEELVVETYKKAWDAFLDTYSTLKSERDTLDHLARKMLRKFPTDSLEALGFRATYDEVTGKKYTDARDKETKNG